MTLVEDFRVFLGSVKSSEALSDELRNEIGVDTQLGNAVLTALQAGNSVVVAGSAGSGKTHLIDVLRSHPDAGLPSLSIWPRDEPPEGADFVWVLRDVTAFLEQVASGEFSSALERDGCRGALIAVNEGPLLGLARDQPDSLYAHAVQLLHEAQQGLVTPVRPDWPTVIDAGSFDPIEGRVVAALLGLPILTQVVDTLPCGCEDPRICPRRIAWALLQFDEVRNRVNDVLRIVNLGGQAVLFRELWDFIADLVLGGDCATGPPTSPWFWRVFYGSSSLSHRLRALADPTTVVFPKAEAHLWYGDLLSDEIELLEGASLIEPAGGEQSARYRWLKAQTLFLIRYGSMLDIVRDQINLELAVSLANRRAVDIVAAINRYMTYGTIPAPQQLLQFWTDTGFERRADRARGEVALGAIETSDLAIRQSQAVANHPEPTLSIAGARHFLVHDASGASLTLTPEVLNLLRGGRSYRSADRPHTDMEWQLDRFFSKAATRGGDPTRLDVIELNFEAMYARPRAYRLAEALRLIEPLRGQN